MRFLPFESFVIESPLSKEEVIRRLLDNIEPEKTFRWFWESDTKKFEGYLMGHEFEMKRVVSYGSSFKPLMKGRIATHGNKTMLLIRMRMDIFTIVLMVFWFGFVGIGLIFILFSGTRDPSHGPIFIPVLMLLLGYLMVVGGYHYESNKAKDLILQITEGRIFDADRD